MDDRIPIDVAALTIPIKAIEFMTALCPLLEGDVWAGAWAFPPSWSQPQREQWTAIHGNLIAEQNAMESVTKGLVSTLESAETQIAQKIYEVDGARRAREAQERLVAGTAAWLKARTQYPGNCQSVQSVEGDVIIMVGMTLIEADAINQRARYLGRKALEAGNETRALQEEIGAQRDGMLAKIVFPDRQRLNDILHRLPSIWNAIREMRDSLSRGIVEVEGKDSAL